MTTATELTAALDAAQTGAPEMSVESAVAVYLGAKAQMDAFSAVADAAKKLISDVMAETGSTAYATKAGKVIHYRVGAVHQLRRQGQAAGSVRRRPAMAQHSGSSGRGASFGRAGGRRSRIYYDD